jgi:S-adenosylmethionine synthetase
MMFGYAIREMENFMPLPIELSHILLQELAAIRHEGVHMTYLRPDSKAQVTVEYDDNNVAVRLDTVVISTQHDPFGGSDTEMQDHISNDIRKILIPRVRDSITLPERISKFLMRITNFWSTRPVNSSSGGRMEIPDLPEER